MSSSLVGLDIGSTGVRAVELKVHGKGKPKLLHAHEILLPPGTVIRGEVIDADTVRSSLKQLWKEGGFKSKNVVLGVGNQSVLIRDLEVPKMSLQHIRESLPFYVQNTLQAPASDFLLDFYPVSETVGEKSTVVNGLLIAAGKTGILENIRVVERAGLRPVEVELIPFALNRILISQLEMIGTVALIDIGATTTSVVVSTDGVPSFVRMISTGGDEVTQALHKQLEISATVAENIKKSLRYEFQEKRGGESPPPGINFMGEKELFESRTVDEIRAGEILRTVIDELLSRLRSTLNYFNNAHPDDPILEIFLTGGGSQLVGISEALGKVTGLAIKSLDPASSFSLPRNKSPKKFIFESTMTVALGLALRMRL